MATPEPGLDRHDWESEYAAVEEDLETDPVAALAELERLVERMLREQGYAIDDPVEESGEERDVVAEFEAARELTTQVSVAGDACDPGDVASAINGLRSIYDYVIAERAAP